MTTSTSRFAHARLDAFRVALRLVREVEAFARQLPRGQADLKDQVRRSAGAAYRNLCEGANRASPRDKASRFEIARGEVGECDALLVLATELGLLERERAMRLGRLTDRLAAMLTGLMRRQRNLAGP
jgi:four helix bundle protein